MMPVKETGRKKFAGQSAAIRVDVGTFDEPGQPNCRSERKRTLKVGVETRGWRE